MDRETSASFIKTVEAGLASVRGSLLLLAQDGGSVDLSAVRRQLASLKVLADENGRPSIAETSAACSAAVAGPISTPADAHRALDLIAAMEADLFSIPLGANGFLAAVSDLVDGSLDELTRDNGYATNAAPEFQIDDETLEIFRSEAEELLAKISLGIDILEASPADQNALWDIRRCAHTFKGAAGIVGLSDAAGVAHRMEDLLDRLVEANAPVPLPVVDFMRGCVRSLGSVADGSPANTAGIELAFHGAVNSLQTPSKIRKTESQPASSVPRSVEQKPVVRISLDRLGEIVRLADELMVNRSSLGTRILDVADAGSARAEIERLLDDGRRLAVQIRDRLVRIRMVRFGMLETRLARAVNVTALDEGKKALLEIETPDVEIDTLIIDALVEPLLHLLKNAVVHGIEAPEVRRLVGKHEFGLISIRVEADDEAVLVSVADDGGGIVTAKLKARAIERNIISPDDAAAMSDLEAYKLLFNKGLSTVETVNLNAGRGVGMSIVKEAVEAQGGSVHIESTPQAGSTFTLMLPVRHDEISRPEPAQELAAPLVLIVDDSASIRRHTQTIVEEAGFRAITAEHGADALELLLNGSVEPDLILSDVEMPHIDGWGLLEYLKTDDHHGHVPVVMVTSLDADEDRERAFALGASDYIVKPFGVKDIERVLALTCIRA